MFLKPLIFKRLLNTNTTTNFFKLFPKTTGSQINFKIDLKTLRKEYRNLQTKLHPDSNIQHDIEQNKQHFDDSQSSLLNKGYSTLKNSLLRSQHILELHDIDLSKDDISKKYSLKDKELLFEILDNHETLENVTNEEELNDLKMENDSRILQSEEILQQLFNENDYENAAVETIRLRYWSNIDNAIKNWEPGKPINLTH